MKGYRMSTEAKAILGLVVLAILIYYGAKDEFALIKQFVGGIKRLGFSAF